GIKRLQPVLFTPQRPDATSKDPDASITRSHNVCPACVKTFTNGSKVMIVKGCGHALCKGCHAKFVKASEKCFVCEKKCKEREAIPLFSEGTGFAGSGARIEVQRGGIAFQ
ncbi:hypothetical protein HK101_007242, partial [Irineochytrium annulatum]